MFALKQPLSFRAVRSVPLRTRALATHAATLPSIPTTSLSETPPVISEKASKDGPMRPHLKISVDPNHGLYALFRRQEKDGVVSYETVEAADVTTDGSGRSWTAAELRRKSFKDLHTLWYVLLRERNLLVTQNEEARRLGVASHFLSTHSKLLRCRKSMARIKYVINERRLAYERAANAYEEQREADLASERAQIEAEKREVATKEEAEARAKEAERRREAGEAPSAARLAGAGLFETVQQSSAPQGQDQTKSS